MALKYLQKTTPNDTKRLLKSPCRHLPPLLSQSMPLYLIFSLRIVYPSERASLACLPAYTLLHRRMIRSMDSRFELPYLLHFKDSSASSTAVLLFQAFAICIKDRKTRLHLYIGTKPSVENGLCLFPCSLYLYALSLSYVTSLEILFTFQSQ